MEYILNIYLKRLLGKFQPKWKDSGLEKFEYKGRRIHSSRNRGSMVKPTKRYKPQT